MSNIISQIIDYGFTIYRTYYGKESDEHWQSLLYSLRHQTKLAFGKYEDDEERDQDDRRKVPELFHLDIREDPSVLDGLDVRRLREFCKAENLKATKVIKRANRETRVSIRPREDYAMADFLFKFVLLADENVLKSVERGEYIVKAVLLRWDGDAGWGWMRILTERCLCFRGPETDLENYIWFGDADLYYTGDCSEIRRWRYYRNQKE
ncbi:hypothetical protein BKA60DRAFT_613636 [Fusarium oxysporum]|nr:hypothetical protein BKA60DRAFT_613636 [Fusarium oxysporum]